jgi:hypothetical protein
MREFKFLNDNKDNGIIGAYNEADLFVPVQLTDRNNGRVFTISYFLLQNMRHKACQLLLFPITAGAENSIEYQGLYRYQITGVQEVEDRQIRYWVTIWFTTPIGNILCYHITETIRS